MLQVGARAMLSRKDETGAVSALFAIFLAPCVVALLLAILELGIVSVQWEGLSSALTASTEQALELAGSPEALGDDGLQHAIAGFMAEEGYSDALIQVKGTASVTAQIRRKGAVSGKMHVITVRQDATWLVSSE